MFTAIGDNRVMDMTFPRLDGCGAILPARTQAPTFPALVAVLAATQSMTPTARAEAACARVRLVRRDILPALAMLFAPRRNEGGAPAPLTGSFHPVVADALRAATPGYRRHSPGETARPRKPG